MLPAEQILLKRLPPDRWPTTTGLVLCQPATAAFVIEAAARCGGPVQVVTRKRSLRLALSYLAHPHLSPHPLRAEPPHASTAILILENGRQLARLLLFSALTDLPPGGRLVVCAANRAGAKTFEDDAAALAPVTPLYAGSAHRLFELTCPPVLRPPPDWPDPVQPVPFDITLRGHSYRLFSRPGVFSAGELDRGSALLLAALPDAPLSPGQRVLDACCGNGVLGLVVAREHSPASLAFADDDRLALDCVSAVLAEGNIPAQVVHADLTLEPPPGPADLILCNPPFHQGLAENRDFVSRFAPAAATALGPAGTLLLVANRFLAYTDVLARSFRKVTTLREDASYRVYLARQR